MQGEDVSSVWPKMALYTLRIRVWSWVCYLWRGSVDECSYYWPCNCWPWWCWDVLGSYYAYIHLHYPYWTSGLLCNYRGHLRSWDCVSLSFFTLDSEIHSRQIFQCRVLVCEWYIESWCLQDHQSRSHCWRSFCRQQCYLALGILYQSMYWWALCSGLYLLSAISGPTTRCELHCAYGWNWLDRCPSANGSVCMWNHGNLLWWYYIPLE